MTRKTFGDTKTLNPYIIGASEIKVNDRFGYKLIAKVWEYSWCVYRGPTDWGDEKVALDGDAVDKKVAVALFPTLAARMKDINKSYGNY
jgi:hypothetical protein